MNKRFSTLLIMMSILAITLAACRGAPTDTPQLIPTEIEEMQPTETSEMMATETAEMAVTESVSIEDQQIASGTVTATEVVSEGPGWLVIHAEEDGSPGTVLGQSPVIDGENTSVVVSIDMEGATDTLYAILHNDTGEVGTYEFPDADPPAQVDGEVVVVPFEASSTEMVTASVSVGNQELTEGQVTVEEVVSEGAGWIVIHADADGSPGQVIGQTAVSNGENNDVVVDINTEDATETLYAMLHTDTDEEGTYEFPDADPPVQDNGEIVMESFQATMPEMEGVSISIQDSEFSPAEQSVPVGTTVVWTHEGSLSHTVTADEGAFDSGTLTNGDTFSFTFEEAGTYAYHCSFHGAPGGQGMSGVITVTEE